MNRLFVFALVASVGSPSLVFADGSLLQSGARHVQQIARSEAATVGAATSVAPLVTSTIPAGLAAAVGMPAAPALQAGQGAPGNLANSGMRKRTKLMIALGLGLGFAVSAWTIDHNVLDITPSSLGTRED